MIFSFSRFISYKLVIAGLLCSLPLLLVSQIRPESSAEIYKDLKKLKSGYKVLYIAAHPDDENTRLISWLSNTQNADVAYLSLTRGDGGQNLIGEEIREELGIIRAEELYAAREIDGGVQFFSHANDFGYSKSAEETFKFWDSTEVLKDMVKVIRYFRPDILITRFDPYSEGRTHGHHTASAQLALNAFELSGDPKAFPGELPAWDPKVVFFNTNWWFYGSEEEFDKIDKSDMIRVDVGVYDPLTGLSSGEIASDSRSMHRSQGFGNARQRGSNIEYLKHLKGKTVTDTLDLFAGLSSQWNSVQGNKEILKTLEQIMNNYDFTNPAASVPDLLHLKDKLQNQAGNPFIQSKIKLLNDIILHAMGVYAEATVDNPYIVPGQEAKVNIEFIHQYTELIALSMKGKKKVPVPANFSFDTTLTVSFDDVSYSVPYWLEEEYTEGMYNYPDSLLFMEEIPSTLPSYKFYIHHNRHRIPLSIPIMQKTVDPALGEEYQSVGVIPQLALSASRNVIIFPGNTSEKVKITVRAYQNIGSATLHIPETFGWEFNPSTITIDHLKSGDQREVEITIMATEDSGKRAVISPFITYNNNHYDKSVNLIDYEHIKRSYFVHDFNISLIKSRIELPSSTVGYLPGAGDQILALLKDLGIDISEIQPEKVDKEYLEDFDVIMYGIRALNVREDINVIHPKIINWVEDGGRLIIQYNTSRRFDITPYVPVPLQIGRDRVTDERSPVTINDPDHPLFNIPHRITAEDFEDWVQERGLYFGTEWDARYIPLLTMNDPGEEDLQGSLLYLPYGEGEIIYTGISFFRQLPAAVPGAYRLLVNMLHEE